MLGENVQRVAEDVVYVVTAPARRSADAGLPSLDNQLTQTIDVLMANNVPNAGRIQGTDDSNLYEVTVPDDQTGDFIVRVDSLAFGMDPYIIVRSLPSDTGTSWEREAFLQADPTSNAYLAIELAVQASDKLQIEVKHFDPEATQGTYQISAGSRLSSDPPSFNLVKTPIDRTLTPQLYFPLFTSK